MNVYYKRIQLLQHNYMCIEELSRNTGAEQCVQEIKIILWQKKKRFTPPPGCVLLFHWIKRCSASSPVSRLKSFVVFFPHFWNRLENDCHPESADLDFSITLAIINGGCVSSVSGIRGKNGLTAMLCAPERRPKGGGNRFTHSHGLFLFPWFFYVTLLVHCDSIRKLVLYHSSLNVKEWRYPSAFSGWLFLLTRWFFLVISLSAGFYRTWAPRISHQISMANEMCVCVCVCTEYFTYLLT